mgnify:FL=1
MWYFRHGDIDKSTHYRYMSYRNKHDILCPQKQTIPQYKHIMRVLLRPLNSVFNIMRLVYLTICFFSCRFVAKERVEDNEAHKNITKEIEQLDTSLKPYAKLVKEKKEQKRVMFSEGTLLSLLKPP